MAKHELHPSQVEALRVLIESYPEIILSMVLDHSATCAQPAAAAAILQMVGWTTGDLVQMVADRAIRELGL